MHGTILIYTSRENQYLQRVKKRLLSRRTAEVLEVSSPEQVVDSVWESRPAVLLFQIHDLEEMKEIEECLERVQELIFNNCLRVLAFTELDSPRAKTVLLGRGCMDVFPVNLVWNEVEKNILHSLSLLTSVQLASVVEENEAEDLLVASSVERPEDWTEPEEFAPELTHKLSIFIGDNDPDATDLNKAKILEMDEQHIVLEVRSEQSFKSGQTFLVVLDDGSGEDKVKVLARSNEVIPTNRHHKLISILIPGNLKKFLEPILKKNAELQIRVQNFLVAARGY